ncbi:hypothetical protein F5Y04DRAFT_290742 [Hypomontagnella monticulosa]|nr:hypothetical protein F5Y04DRAFT_290742 [Hypomontagnella monticulosa]
MNSKSPGPPMASPAQPCGARAPWWSFVYGTVYTLQDRAMDEDQQFLRTESNLSASQLEELHQQRQQAAVSNPKPPIFGSTTLKPGMDAWVASLNHRNQIAYEEGEDYLDMTHLTFEDKLPNPTKNERCRRMIAARKGLDGHSMELPPICESPLLYTTPQETQAHPITLNNLETPGSTFCHYWPTDVDYYRWQILLVIELTRAKYRQLRVRHPNAYRSGLLAGAQGVEMRYRIRDLLKLQAKDMERKVMGADD